jgi:uncharacterized protein (TIGR02466 family)
MAKKKTKDSQQVPEFKTYKITGEQFFSTQIYFKDLENSKDINTKLIKNLTAWKNRDEKGIVRSNSLGWHSAVDMHHRKEYNYIIKELFKMQSEIFKHESYNTNTEAYCDNMWANINYKYSHNRNHVHPGALWAGCYYVQAPKHCGRIWFTDPRGEAHCQIPIFENTKDIQRPRNSWREVYYEPVPGRIIMFPGWLTHEVEPNMNKLKGVDSWRISLAFNFGQRWKQGQYNAPPKGHDSQGIITESNIPTT